MSEHDAEFGARKRLAVLGQPIGHSKSPEMHSAAFGELGLADEWSYEAIEVSPARFERAVRAMPARGFVGANVTIPHKRAALEVADTASDAARRIGAANTLSFGPGGIRADNTDAQGLLDALPVAPTGAEALVLGAGGAARAAIWALSEAGARVSIWNRTESKAAALAEEFGVDAVRGGPPAPEACEILVNATAIGLAGTGDSSSEDSAFKMLQFAADQLSDRQVVVDLVYGATETELVRAAAERGAKTIDGLEILVRQGAASFRLWTGLEAPLATMRRAVRPQRS